MNTRLQNLYSSIEKSNKEKFLDNDIEIDQIWGNPIWGVTLQLDLGAEVKNQLVSYQKKLEELEPDNLLLLPKEYQHISFNQVVFWGGKYKLGTEKTWNAISTKFLSAFKKRINQFK